MTEAQEATIRTLFSPFLLTPARRNRARFQAVRVVSFALLLVAFASACNADLDIEFEPITATPVPGLPSPTPGPPRAGADDPWSLALQEYLNANLRELGLSLARVITGRMSDEEGSVYMFAEASYGEEGHLPLLILPGEANVIEGLVLLEENKSYGGAESLNAEYLGFQYDPETGALTNLGPILHRMREVRFEILTAKGQWSPLISPRDQHIEPIEDFFGNENLASVLEHIDVLKPISQTFFLDTAEASATSPLSLADGQRYRVIISGTFSYWVPDQWHLSGVCGGAPEASPIHPSPSRAIGMVGADPEYNFSVPDYEDVCLDGRILFPRTTILFNFVGNIFIDLNPSRPHYNPAHEYEYLIRGRGQPLTIQLEDIPYQDNYGRLKISVIPRSSQ